MNRHHVSLLVFFLILLMSLSHETLSFSFTWGSNKDDHSDYQKSAPVAKFSMELPNDPKGIDSVETAQQRLASRTSSCWKDAYENLFATCSVIVKDIEKRSRLAWQLSDCFQKDSGRPSFPSCDSQSYMLKCLKKLDESAHKVYPEFYLQTNSICHQLQLIQNSDQIENSLTSLDIKAQQVAETSEKVRDQIDVSLKHSNFILKQSKEIAASQLELRQGQSDMRETLEGGMKILHQSYEKLINKVSNSMTTKMENLQNKANDIGNVAGISLDKQKQLLDGASVQTLAEFGQKQQEELLRRQEQLQQAHDHLIENSKSIWQLSEPRKSFCLDLYYCSRSISRYNIFCYLLLYMLTCAKQTYGMRARLYLGIFFYCWLYFFG
ncbi:hypothetical protein MKX01_016251 [Papaver californicum]|nr:hypothetical protein MKX01_016251 [Papaver californicum]